MALNIVWIAFFLIAFVVAMYKLIVLGDTHIFQDMVNSTFDAAKTAADISLGLIGIMTLWLGIMKIGERGGVVRAFSRLVRPVFSKLFPEIPPDHPAGGSILMNFSANMLGLDNAATPLGLKAMKELQELNTEKDTASNAMIMFLVLNASSLTLLPISIMAYRSQVKIPAANPADVFLPILLATFFSTLTGLVSVAIYQRINLFQKALLLPLGGLTLVIGALLYFFSQLPAAEVNTISEVLSNFLLFSVIIAFIVLAMIRKVNVYSAFIDGAVEGFQIAIKIIPYLVAILVAVAVFRVSGCMDYLIQGIAAVFHALGVNTDFVPALPVALMKPLSGSGARGLMVEIMNQYGADSFPGRVACVIQGSTETTFYVLAVYFGSVNIKKTRYTLQCALLAELAGIVAAIIIAYIFFHHS
ncbi:nucleoside recognition domain-containing protein [Thermoflavifilum thermophilum]|uniref:Spore maturation protein SpmA n=1 Tax=Thermoflavifilum thermophilum TaxID=1393122 RepID=A0A1I7NIJ1_9BACT|nr:spore maturation protein [Thermoflavifilum thermophilum]SFV34484.1 Spore maturation protein SpmA [Thermoflavifilum thermophilum]